MTTRAVDPSLFDDTRTFEMESSRVRRSLDLAVAYQSLVDIAVELPIGAGAAEVVNRVLDGLAQLLPHRAIGACVALPDAEAPLVELRLPPLLAAPGRDPTRLFPELSDELVVELRGLRDSTLHVGNVSGKFDDDPAEASFVGRAAEVLATGIAHVVALGNARPASAEVLSLRAQVIQAEKLASLGQLVAGVVHELANPVTSIVACTDFLLHRRSAASAPPEDIEHIRRIEASAERILKFSRDLVSYARPASETPGPVSIADVVQQAKSFCAHEFEKASIAFVADFANEPPFILGQSGPLVQVFVNLFTNAAHAMGERGGRLSVTAETDLDARRLLVRVTDTGVGIPPEFIPKIFEPFFTTKDKGRGSGLGLSIVREIVQTHSGTIDATSTLGEGTTFALSLPLYPG